MSPPRIFVANFCTVMFTLASQPVTANGLALELGAGNAISRDATTTLNEYFVDTDTLAQAQANKQRNAWHVILRYDFSTQLQIRAGYVELGPLDTRLLGETTEVNAYLRSNPEIPLNSVSGWLVSTAYQYALNEVANFRTKIGLYRWEASYSLKSGDFFLQRDNAGTSPVLGFDLGIKLTPYLTSRFGWDIYDINGYKNDILFIGIELH